MQIALADLRLDGGTQPRAAIDYALVSDYAEQVRAGAIFPAVVVFYDGTDYWLADGFHRVKAAREAQLEAIVADVRQGTREDAVWFSCGANQAHGLRRTNMDKRRAVAAALKHAMAAGLSDRAIAEHCGVGPALVGDVRREIVPAQLFDSNSSTRKGKDGKVRNTTSEKQAKGGKASAEARAKKKAPAEAPVAEAAPDSRQSGPNPAPVDFLRHVEPPAQPEPRPEPRRDFGSDYHATLASLRLLSARELEEIRKRIIPEYLRNRRQEVA